jgi:hypothetical protein
MLMCFTVICVVGVLIDSVENLEFPPHASASSLVVHALLSLSAVKPCGAPQSCQNMFCTNEDTNRCATQNMFCTCLGPSHM